MNWKADHDLLYLVQAAVAAEVLVADGQWRVIRRRQTIDDMTACETSD